VTYERAFVERKNADKRKAQTRRRAKGISQKPTRFETV